MVSFRVLDWSPTYMRKIISTQLAVVHENGNYFFIVLPNLFYNSFIICSYCFFFFAFCLFGVAYRSFSLRLALMSLLYLLICSAVCKALVEGNLLSSKGSGKAGGLAIWILILALPLVPWQAVYATPCLTFPQKETHSWRTVYSLQLNHCIHQCYLLKENTNENKHFMPCAPWSVYEFIKPSKPPFSIFCS